jgi:hypothetical protein
MFDSYEDGRSQIWLKDCRPAKKLRSPICSRFSATNWAGADSLTVCAADWAAALTLAAAACAAAAGIFYAVRKGGGGSAGTPAAKDGKPKK